MSQKGQLHHFNIYPSKNVCVKGIRSWASIVLQKPPKSYTRGLKAFLSLSFPGVFLERNLSRNFQKISQI